jgi:ribosomal protein L15E
MEIDLYGNHLKLENNEIYNYRQINQYGKKKWYKIIFSLNKMVI